MAWHNLNAEHRLTTNPPIVARPGAIRRAPTERTLIVNNIIYIVGLIVIIAAVASYFGLR